MPLITQVDIQEFRGIKGCDKPIEFKEFNVLIGRNNSGKSSILEAMSLMPYPYEKKPIIARSPLWLLHQLHTERANFSTIDGGDSIGQIERLVHRYSGNATVAFQYEKEKMTLKISPEDPEAGRQEIPPIQTTLGGKFYDSTSRNILTTSSNGGDDSSRTSDIFFIPNHDGYLNFLSYAMTDIRFRDSSIKKGSNVRVCKDLINPSVDDSYTEILWDGSDIKLRKEYTDSIGYIYVNDLGDGVKKTALIALALDYVSPRLVLWDDVERAAHPALIKTLTKWLSSKDWQVILATHSLDVLKAIIELRPKESQFIMCKKDRDDHLYTTSYHLDEFEDLFYSNSDPRFIADSLGL